MTYQGGRRARIEHYAGPLRSDPVVLVWCRGCERFIASEVAHGCSLPPYYRAERAAARARKLEEVGR